MNLSEYQNKLLEQQDIACISVLAFIQNCYIIEYQQGEHTYYVQKSHESIMGFLGRMNDYFENEMMEDFQEYNS